tara:strand:+ start:1274 stop:2275 length:1002 start_codon:yes stop_codon:yes gene_type:complete
MGAMCASSTINLPSYGQTLGGTTLPAWVSAGGRSLFEQSAELAKSPYPLYRGQRIASYDGSKLTPEEQQAADILAGSAGEIKPYIDRATELAGELGKGYGATSRADLIGDDFTLESAQPFLDIYQGAQDAAVREIGDQTTLQQNQARASAARSGAFGGSRLGITEAMLGSEGAQAAGDLRARAAAEGLGFAANRFDTDRAARFSAEDAARAGYETDESSRLRQQEIYTSMAPLVQGLREQTAAGLMSTGEAKRRLDQMALDMAYADYQDQRAYPYEQINFALGTLQGTPYNTQNYGYNMAQQYAQGPSVYGQTIGALGTLGAGYFAGRNRGSN